MTEEESVSLKQHLEDLIHALDAQMEQRFTYIEKTIERSIEGINSRLDRLSEFRDGFEMRLKDYLTKDEYDQAHAALSDRLDAIVKLVYVGLGLAVASGYLIKMVIDHITK